MRGRVQQIEPGCEYGDNKFIDCFVINRDLLIDIINNYANADYLDFFEAIAGDFARIATCAATSTRASPSASSTSAPTTSAAWSS